MAIKTTSQLNQFDNGTATGSNNIGGKLAYYSNAASVLTENDIKVSPKYLKPSLSANDSTFYSSFFEISKPAKPGIITPNEEYQSMKVGYNDLIKNIIWDVKAYLNYRHSLNNYDLSCIVDGDQNFSGNKTFNNCNMVVDNTLSVGKQLSASDGTFTNIKCDTGTFTNVKCDNLSVTNFISGYAYGLKDGSGGRNTTTNITGDVTYKPTTISSSDNPQATNFYNKGNAKKTIHLTSLTSKNVNDPVRFDNGRPVQFTVVQKSLKLAVPYFDSNTNSIKDADVLDQASRILGGNTITSNTCGCIITKCKNVDLSRTEPEFLKNGIVATLRDGIPYPQNTIGFAYYAKHAFWSDLGEKYLADAKYEPGTLVKFGGEKEITIADDEVNAIVSTNAFDLNSCLKNGTTIALCGRVPTKVKGKIKKFDKVMLSDVPGVACKWDGKSRIIGRALESNDNEDVKLVECVTRFEI